MHAVLELKWLRDHKLRPKVNPDRGISTLYRNQPTRNSCWDVCGWLYLTESPRDPVLPAPDSGKARGQQVREAFLSQAWTEST